MKESSGPNLKIETMGVASSLSLKKVVNLVGYSYLKIGLKKGLKIIKKDNKRTRKMSTSEFLVPIDSKFNINDVIIDEPVLKEIGKGKDSFKYLTSDVYKLDENGNKRSLYFEFPESNGKGILPTYTFGVENPSEEDINGFNLIYYHEYYRDPRLKELNNKIFKRIDMIISSTARAFEKYSKTIAKYVPSCKTLTKKSSTELIQYIKPLHKDVPTSEDPREEFKSNRFYFLKLLCNKKNKKISSDVIYNKQGETISPNLCRTLRKTRPVVLWKDVFWGKHGYKAWKASIRLVVTEVEVVVADTVY